MKLCNVPPAYDRNNGEATPGVSAKASDAAKAVAFDFIKYILCNDDALVQHNLLVYVAPAKKAVMSRPEITGDATLAGQASILDRTFWPGTVPSVYWDDIAKYMSDPIMNGKAPADVLPSAETKINADVAAADPNFAAVERTYAHASDMRTDRFRTCRRGQPRRPVPRASPGSRACGEIHEMGFCQWQ